MLGHWSCRYVGKPYIKGKYDCMDMCEEVMRNEFHFTPNLPVHNDELKEMSLQLKKGVFDYGRKLGKGDRLADGDFVLMKNGRLYHAGIYCVIKEKQYVLHCTKSAGQVIIERLHSLAKSNLKIEGFYKWKGKKEHALV